ncbi:Roundabout-like protein 3 [Trichoplax sp. H2]|nr:Roundabout-like protein 3 [Trichoplax sp. H2]|eukprot:RDD40847.1 Roundabout-like protein 3 [Trichoplax sp. H2]
MRYPKLLLFLFILASSRHSLAMENRIGAAPVFIEEPQDFIVRRNTGITLRCSATGSPYPKITWLKNGKLLVIDPKINPRLLLIGGALYITKVTKTSKYTDAGIYQCMAKNQFGSVFSRNATITIAYLRDKFRISPSNITITTSGTAKLTCHAPRANPKPSIMWEKNGKIIQSGGRITYTTTPESVLTIPNVDHYDLGFYVCVAENLAGVKRSEAAYLTVNEIPRFINKAQTRVSVAVGAKLTLDCSAKGLPKPKIQWFYGKSVITENDPRFQLRNMRLHVENIQLENAGTFTCVVANVHKEINRIFTVNIEEPPKFTVVPVDKWVEVGKLVYFNCKANHAHALFWRKIGTDSLMFAGQSEVEGMHVLNNGTLVIKKAVGRDSGLYQCSVIGNMQGRDVLVRLVVRVDTTATIPVIKPELFNKTVFINDTVTIKCNSKGDPQPIVYWRKNDQLLKSNDTRVKRLSWNTIGIKLVQTSDQGWYMCGSYNNAGLVTSVAYLRVVEQSYGVPKAPYKPYQTQIGSSFIRLRWDIPKDGERVPVLVYIDCYEVGGRKKRTRVGTISITEFTIRNLKPNTRYQFQIVSINGYGTSTSPMSSIIRTKLTSTATELSVTPTPLNLQTTPIFNRLEFNITALSPSSVLLRWNKVGNGETFTYTVAYVQKYGTQDNWHTVNTTATQIIISRLEEHFEYDFILKTYLKNKQVDVRRLSFTMPESVPAVAPVLIDAYKVNNTIALKWERLTKSQLNGKFYAYLIRLSFRDGSIDRNLTIYRDEDFAVIRKINAKYEYLVSMAVSTNVGIGPWSIPIAVGSGTTDSPTISSGQRFILSNFTWLMIVCAISGVLIVTSILICCWCVCNKNKKSVTKEKVTVAAATDSLAQDIQNTGADSNARRCNHQAYNSTDNGDSSISSESYNASSYQISQGDNASAHTTSQAAVDVEGISILARGSTGHVDSIGIQSESTLTSDRREVRTSLLDEYYYRSVRGEDIVADVLTRNKSAINSNRHHSSRKTIYPTSIFSEAACQIPNRRRHQLGEEGQDDAGYTSLGSGNQPMPDGKNNDPPPPYHSDNNIAGVNGIEQEESTQNNVNATAESLIRVHSRRSDLPGIEPNDNKAKRKTKQLLLSSKNCRSAPTLAKENSSRFTGVQLLHMPDLSNSFTTGSRQLKNHPLHISNEGSDSPSFGHQSSLSNVNSDQISNGSSSSQQFVMEIMDANYEIRNSLSLYTNPLHQQNQSFTSDQYFQEYDISSLCRPEISDESEAQSETESQNEEPPVIPPRHRYDSNDSLTRGGFPEIENNISRYFAPSQNEEEEEVIDYPYHHEEVAKSFFDEDLTDLPSPCPIDDLDNFPNLKSVYADNRNNENLFRFPNGDYKVLMQPTHVKMNSSPSSSLSSSPPLHPASYSYDYTLNSEVIDGAKNKRYRQRHQDYSSTNPHLSKLSTQLQHSYDEKILNDNRSRNQDYQFSPVKISRSQHIQSMEDKHHDEIDDIASVLYRRAPSFDYIDEVASAKIHQDRNNITEFTL